MVYGGIQLGGATASYLGEGQKWDLDLSLILTMMMIHVYLIC